MNRQPLPLLPLCSFDGLASLFSVAKSWLPRTFVLLTCGDVPQEEMSAAEKQYNEANERIADLQRQLEVRLPAYNLYGYLPSSSAAA